MPLESVVFINDLNVDNPRNTDTVAQGDDHLRLIKLALRNTFINADRAHRLRHYRVVQLNSARAITLEDEGTTFAINFNADGSMTLPNNAPVGWICSFRMLRTVACVISPATGQNFLLDSLVSGNAVTLSQAGEEIEVVRHSTLLWGVRRASAALNQTAIFAPGDVKFSGSPTIPSGWLDCDGAAVSRTTYVDLFSVVGTRFGPGDGAATFNVPNLQGKVPAGLLVGETQIGDEFGEAERTLTEAQLPPHTHRLVVPPHRHSRGSLQTTAAGRHRHSIQLRNQSEEAGGSHPTQRPNISAGTYYTTYEGEHTHAITGATEFDGGIDQRTIPEDPAVPLDMRQPTLVFRGLIKT